MNEDIPFVAVVRPIECELEDLVLAAPRLHDKSVQYLVLYIKQL